MSADYSDLNWTNDSYTHSRRRKQAPVVGFTDSWWLDRPRDGFTAYAQRIQDARCPQTTMSGITLLAAQKNGTL